MKPSPVCIDHNGLRGCGAAAGSTLRDRKSRTVKTLVYIITRMKQSISIRESVELETRIYLLNLRGESTSLLCSGRSEECRESEEG